MNRGGLGEALAACIALWALVALTPAGALFDRALDRPARPLLSYFSSDASARTPALLPDAAGDDAARAAALRAGSRAELVVALALLLSEGRRTPDGAPDVTLGPVAAAALQSVGALPPGPTDARVRLDALAAGLPRLAAELGSEEAAVAALAAGGPLVRAAIEAAARHGSTSPAMLSELAPHLPRQARADALELGHAALGLATGLGLGWPVEPSTRVSSPFGERFHPILRTRRFHTGVDLSVPVGTAIHATAAATVQRAGEDAVNGRFLVLDHGHGLTTSYCHADELLVARGDRVGSGALIARSGNTGRSTGPHLHYQVSLGGQVVDPLRLSPPGRAALALLQAPPPGS